VRANLLPCLQEAGAGLASRWGQRAGGHLSALQDVEGPGAFGQDLVPLGRHDGGNVQGLQENAGGLDGTPTVPAILIVFFSVRKVEE